MTSVNLSSAATSLLQSAGTLPQRASPAPTESVTRTSLTMPVSGDEVAKPTREAVDQAAKHIQAFVQSVGRSLDFSVDQSTGQTVLRVINPDNGELVRQLPAEETLRVARAIDYMQSMLVNQRA